MPDESVHHVQYCSIFISLFQVWYLGDVHLVGHSAQSPVAQHQTILAGSTSRSWQDNDETHPRSQTWLIKQSAYVRLVVILTRSDATR